MSAPLYIGPDDAGEHINTEAVNDRRGPMSVAEKFLITATNIQSEALEGFQEAMYAIGLERDFKLETIPKYIAIQTFIRECSTTGLKRDILSGNHAKILAERTNARSLNNMQDIEVYATGIIDGFQINIGIDLLSEKREAIIEQLQLYVYDCILNMKLFQDNQEEVQKWKKLYYELCELIPTDSQDPIIIHQGNETIEINKFGEIKEIDNVSGNITFDESDVGPEIKKLEKEIEDLKTISKVNLCKSLEGLREIIQKCEEEYEITMEYKKRHWKELQEKAENVLYYLDESLM